MLPGKSIFSAPSVLSPARRESVPYRPAARGSAPGQDGSWRYEAAVFQSLCARCDSGRRCERGHARRRCRLVSFWANIPGACRSSAIPAVAARPRSSQLRSSPAAADIYPDSSGDRPRAAQSRSCSRSPWLLHEAGEDWQPVSQRELYQLGAISPVDTHQDIFFPSESHQLAGCRVVGSSGEWHHVSESTLISSARMSI